MSKFNALATLNRVLQPLVERADDDDVRARVTITEEGDFLQKRDVASFQHMTIILNHINYIHFY